MIVAGSNQKPYVPETFLRLAALLWYEPDGSFATIPCPPSARNAADGTWARSAPPLFEDGEEYPRAVDRAVGRRDRALRAGIGYRGGHGGGRGDDDAGDRPPFLGAPLAVVAAAEQCGAGSALHLP